jgi:hypothetical protein
MPHGLGSVLAALVVSGSFVVTACTEDPKLEKVGGNGSTDADARPTCADSVPDAEPRFFPCNVEAVLVAKCQRCHNEKAVLDLCSPEKKCLKGPFPLLSWSDTHQLFGDQPIFELMRMAVLTDYMPFKTDTITPPVAPLTADEKATLVAWTTVCAPAGTAPCGPKDAGGVAAEGAADR